jgi:hypothetical protein
MKKILFLFFGFVLVSTSNIFAQISFDDYVDASTDESIAYEYSSNVYDLLSKANALLRSAGIYSVTLSAAGRTATRSGGVSFDGLHNVGRAIDIVDRDGRIYRAVEPLIQGSGLRLENRDSTPTWVHLDIGRDGVANDVRGGRVFRP